jgi:spectinomycin phosphotransferase
LRAAALARQWAFTVRELSYLPVGFGGYHWLAVDQTGARWFVTVSDLAAPWVPDLSAAMHTAAWLASEAGPEFVVAPVPTRAGQVVGSLDSRHALTLFPYLDAAPSRFEDPIDDGDRAAIIDLLATLHTAAPTGIQVPSRPLELASREVIDQALASLDAPWKGGPYAEPGRDLLARYDEDVERYSSRTGWAVNQDALALYRLRWSLDETAEFLSEIRAPHQETADTLVSWTALQETLEAIA